MHLAGAQPNKVSWCCSTTHGAWWRLWVSGGVRLELSWDSEHDVCSPSAQGTVALELGGKNPRPGNLFLFGFVFVLCEWAGEAKLHEGARGEVLSQRSCLGWQDFLPRPALDFAFVGFMKKFVDFDRKYVEKLLNIVVCFSLSSSALLVT